MSCQVLSRFSLVSVPTYTSQKLAVGAVIDMLCLSAKDPESLVCRLTSDGAEYEAMETALNDTYHTGEQGLRERLSLFTLV